MIDNGASKFGNQYQFATIEDCLADISDGKMIVIVDDPDRENEGDLMIAPEKATPETINFMAKHARGLICLALPGDRCDQLELPLQVNDNTSRFATAFTVTIDAKEGTTTGISAADRARTIQVAVAPETKPSDLARPGHIFPLRAKRGGVLKRTGQTEASVDMARLAGLTPGGVICEIMNEDGTMARVPELMKLAGEHGIKVMTIEDLIAYRMRNEKLVHRLAETKLPTPFGNFETIAYASEVDMEEHIALIMGDISSDEPILVRVHSECLTGDVFLSQRCDCGDQLHSAMRMIADEGRGILLYMRQEGRGIGLANKLKAYALQDHGFDTVQANLKLGFPPDRRDYGIGAQILSDLGARKIRLMSNNPKKFIGLRGYNLEVVERVPIEIAPNATNIEYLRTKRSKMGHLLNNLDQAVETPAPKKETK